jgi:hypothetical protein
LAMDRMRFLFISSNRACWRRIHVVSIKSCPGWTPNRQLNGNHLSVLFGKLFLRRASSRMFFPGPWIVTSSLVELDCPPARFAFDTGGCHILCPYICLETCPPLHCIHLTFGPPFLRDFGECACHGVSGHDSLFLGHCARGTLVCLLRDWRHCGGTVRIVSRS